MLFELESHDRIGVVGVTGAGKTRLLVESIITPARARGLRVVALNVKNEQLGLPYHWTADQFFQEPQVLEEERLALSIAPEDRHDVARAALLCRRLIAALQRLHTKGFKKPTLLVLTELHHYGRRVQQEVTTAAAMDRDLGLILAVDTTRAVDITIGTRAQMNHLVSFAQSEPADIEWIRGKTELTDPTFHERVQRLSRETHGYEYWREGAPSTQHQPGEDAHGEEKEQRGQPGNRGDADVQDGADPDRGGRPGGPEVPVAGAEEQAGRVLAQGRRVDRPEGQAGRVAPADGSRPKHVNTKRRRRTPPPQPKPPNKRRRGSAA